MIGYVFFIGLLSVQLLRHCFAGEIFDPSQFDAVVMQDPRVFCIEFYSSMCGSCTEFAPTWATLEGKMTSVVTAKVNIDEKSGMALAQKLGVLDEGLPNIRLFSRAGEENGESILAGDAIPVKKLWSKLKHSVSSLSKANDGFYQKQDK